MSGMIRLARPGLALAIVAAVLAVPAGAAGAGRTAQVSGVPGLAGRAPTAYVSVVGSFRTAGRTVVPIATITN